MDVDGDGALEELALDGMIADDGKLLGYAGVRLSPAVAATAEPKRMFVLPAGRGSGLGRGPLVAVESAVVESGASRIVCETNAELTAARALYAAYGFEETRPYPGHGGADHRFAKAIG